MYLLVCISKITVLLIDSFIFGQISMCIEMRWNRCEKKLKICHWDAYHIHDIYLQETLLWCMCSNMSSIKEALEIQSVKSCKNGCSMLHMQITQQQGSLSDLEWFLYELQLTTIYILTLVENNRLGGSGVRRHILLWNLYELYIA